MTKTFRIYYIFRIVALICLSVVIVEPTLYGADIKEPIVSENPKGCTYADKFYSEGSIIEMGGTKKMCRDNALEITEFEKDAGEEYKYYHPPLADLAWRSIASDP